MATFEITPEKEEYIRKLIKSLKEIESCIEPYKEQRKELRSLYTKENDWLTNEEYSMVKKAFNAAKNDTDMDDFASFVEIAKKEMPSYN